MLPELEILDTNLDGEPENIASPETVMRKLRTTPEIVSHVARSRRTIGNILDGEDHRLAIFVGPCSIHSKEVAYEYAERLAAVAKRLQDRLFIGMRVYFEKPRTTLGWKGLIYDPDLDNTCDVEKGLYLARKILLKVGRLGLAAATEWLDPITPQYFGDLVSWGAIGARTTESQIHRQLASASSMPIGFKNSTDGNCQVAVNGVLAARADQVFLGIDRVKGRVARVRSKGNRKTHIVLRGSEKGPNYGQESVREAQGLLIKAGLPPRLAVDCSHGNCNKEWERQILAFQDVITQRVLGNTGIIGAMLESNIHEGNQRLEEVGKANLKYGVSITDQCIGWEKTLELLEWAYDAMRSPQAVAV